MRGAPWVVFMLLAGGILTRGIFLTHPREVVFDEVHFGKFVSAYCCTGERFFDIHPPHAKLLVALAVSPTSYGGRFSFSHIGQSYGETPVVAFRLVPVVAGVLLPLVVYWLLRLVGVSVVGAGIGGAVIVFDNALIVQSRVISLDGVLLASIFAAIAFILAARKVSSWRRMALLFLGGAAAGLAAGSKFTGVVALGLIGLIWLADSGRVFLGAAPGRSRRLSGQALLGVIILLGFATVYMGGWVMHFALLTEPGSGDAWRAPVVYAGVRGIIAHPLVFWQELVEWHRLMLRVNYDLKAGHPDASPWWSWPLLLRPVFYWTGAGAVIYLLGNPVVWWGSTVVLGVMVGQRILQRCRRWAGLATQSWPRARRHGSLWVFYIGYIAALAPLMRVPRALFLYHYFTALVFAVLLACAWLDRKGVWRSSRLVMAAIFFLGVGFIAVSPVTYALPLPVLWQNILAQLPRWQ